jgi:2-dehydropantoate 2-reductase
VAAEALHGAYDLVLLSCKAYDLESAVESFAAAVGPRTAVLPLLNGMRHLDLLDRRVGAGRVLGGLCLISATLDHEGRILHLNEHHDLVFGERSGEHGPRVTAIAELFEGVRVHARPSPAMLREMWEKWVFIAALAGSTCLLRAPIGDLVAAGAGELATSLLDECAAIAAAEGFAPGDAALARSRAMLTAPGSPLAASMLRDIERHAPTEGDHIVGDLLRRADARSMPASLLRAAAAHLRAYEVRRAREAHV